MVVVDDPERENEGDLVFAASHATAELVGFMVRYTSGVICVPADGAVLDRLEISLLVPRQSLAQCAFCMSVDASAGVGSGISAQDRALTIRTLADQRTEPGDLVRPGHVFPLRYTEGGVLARRGHTEAAVDLVRLAGLPPVAALSEVCGDDGAVLQPPQLRVFADRHGLALVSVEQLVRCRQPSASVRVGRK